MKNLSILMSVVFACSLSGCALFFGNIKPAEEKSTHYTIEDLSQSTSTWKRVTNGQEAEASEASRPDASYQSTQTSAVISVTSGCKKTSDSQTAKSLSEQTKALVLGLSALQFQATQTTQVGQKEALWSKVSGEVNGVPVRMEIVVFQSKDCFYDLVLVGRSPLSSADLDTFSHFVSTFHFK